MSNSTHDARDQTIGAAPSPATAETQGAREGGPGTSLRDAGMQQVIRALGAQPLSERFPTVRYAEFIQHPTFFARIRDRVIVSDKAVNMLLEARATDDFIRYTMANDVDLELRDFEIAAFLKFRAEVGDVLQYRGAVPHILNVHRFTKATLDLLVRNWQDRSKKRPLRLVVVSGEDSNGYLHRNAGLAETVAHPSHLALMIEATGSLEAVQAEFGPVARTYGPNDKIDDAILVAHASPSYMPLGYDERGSVRPHTHAAPRPANPRDAQQDRGQHFALRVGGEQDDQQFTQAFFADLIGQMRADPDHPPTITLMGCHTDGAEPVYPDHKNGPGRDRARALIVKQQSLASALRAQVASSGKPIRVVGATQFSMDYDKWIDPKTGSIAPVNPTDAQAYGEDKNEYVASGTNFVDVFASVQVAWAHRRPQLAAAIERRMSKPTACPWEPVIQAMLAVTMPQIENPRVISDMHDLAVQFNAMAAGTIPWVLLRTLPRVWRETIFQGLSRCPVWTVPRIRFACLQSWLGVDHAKGAQFLSELEGVKSAELPALLSPPMLESELPRLLRAPAASPPPAEAKLAIGLIMTGIIEGPTISAGAQRYLRSVLGSRERFGFDVAAHLPPGKTEVDLLRAIGRGELASLASLRGEGHSH